MEIEPKRKVTIRTWEEKKALCEQWKASGKTRRDFCKENNIPIASFFPWRNKLWPESKKQSPSILPVKIINKPLPAEITVAHTEIELKVGESLSMRFKLPIKNIVTFIQEVSHAVATIR